MAARKIGSSEDLEYTISNGVALVDFNAPWCAPCRAQTPIVNQVADRFEGKAVVAEMNIDENPETAQALKIHSIPTLAVFKNGKEIQRLVGLQPFDTLSEIMETMLKQTHGNRNLKQKKILS